MTAVISPLVTEVEFMALPETNQHIELVDGEVVMPPAPTYSHQRLLQRVVYLLTSWVERSGPGASPTVAQSPLDIRFGPNRILQPDAMVFLVPLPVDIERPIARIPDVCIEVVSLDRKYDRVTKRFLYGAAGVREYWIVDPGQRGIEQCAGDELAEMTLVTDRLSSSLLPGFELDVPRLFADPEPPNGR